KSKITSFVGEAMPSRGPAKFHDAFAMALVIPLEPGAQEVQDRIVRDHVAKYFEETWIHQPLKSLGGISPIDAAASPTIRRSVLGLLAFLAQIGTMGGRQSIYDFDRLRRKLGLAGDGSGSADVPAGAVPATDISAMGAAELAGLPAESLQAAEL